MKTHKEVLVEGSDYQISLKKMLEKNIKDITGYLTGDFGEPVFHMSYVIFEDGTELSCEGEHDNAYLVQAVAEEHPDPEIRKRYCSEYNDEILENIRKTDPDYEDEE